MLQTILHVPISQPMKLGILRFLPESPRWMVSMGKYDEAAAILVQIAETNGKSIEKKDLLQKLQVL